MKGLAKKLGKVSRQQAMAIAACLLVSVHSLHARIAPDVLGFDESTLEYHFERADREASPDAWALAAREGVSAAVAAWERLALELYADAGTAAEARRALEAWTDAEFEERFAAWLIERFLGAEAADAAQTVEALSRAAAVPYIYHTDERGAVLYDEATGDPLVLRPDDSVFSDDRADWLDEVSAYAGAALSAYIARVNGIYPELLEYIDEDRRAEFGETLAVMALGGAENLRTELSAVIAREERYFTAARLGDVWSLRQNSEAGSAQTVAASVIEEAQAACEAGITGLKGRIEKARTGAGDLSLMGEEWLAQYQEQFERGLSAWESAEERFFVSRLEWERDAAQSYEEGVETWNAAYETLLKERGGWEVKAYALLESAIAEVRAEFQSAAALRTRAAAERAGAYTDVYLTSGLAAVRAVENIDFWLTRYEASGTPKADDAAFGAWLAAEEQVSTGRDPAVLSEIRAWYDMYVSYMNKAKEVKTALAQEFALAMGGGALDAVLEHSADTEVFSLDEYQLELLRAQAIAEYWEREAAEAEAVLRYAEDLSAGRATEGESARIWAEAKSAYETAAAQYEETRKRLSEAGKAVEAAQYAMTDAGGGLEAANARLAALNADYSALISAGATKDQAFLMEQLSSLYTELALDEKEIEEYDFTEYIAIAFRYDELTESKHRWLLLQDMVTGGGEYEGSLADLARAAAAIVDIGDGDDPPETIAGFAIPADNSAYMEIAACMAEREILVAQYAEDETALEYVETVYREAVTILAQQAKLRAETALLERLDALKGFDPAEEKAARDEALAALTAIFESLGMEDAGQAKIGSWFTRTADIMAALEAQGGGAASAAAFLARLDAALSGISSRAATEYGAWRSAFASYAAARFIRNGGTTRLSTEIFSELGTAEAALSYADTDTFEALYNKYLFLKNEYELAVHYETLAEQAALVDTADEKHWREYLTAEVASQAEWVSTEGAAAGGIRLSVADNYAEGALLDAERRLVFEARKFASALSYTGGDDAFQAIWDAAQRFAQDNTAEWDTDLIVRADYMAEDAYIVACATLNGFLSNHSTIQKSYRQAGASYEFRSADFATLEALKRQKYAEITAQRAAVEDMLSDWQNAAAIFADMGAKYDQLYGEAKDASAATEEALAAYRMQDAVRRWASTAYTGADDTRAAAESARAFADRAAEALASLSALYTARETMRPYDSDTYNTRTTEYKAALTRFTAIIDARDAMSAKLSALLEENKLLRQNYEKQFARWMGALAPCEEGAVEVGEWDITKDYVSNANQADWRLKDIIRVSANGTPEFSRNGSTFTLSGATASSSAALYDYFFASEDADKKSALETEIAGLSARMSSYITDIGAYKNFAVARDYLVRMLIKENGGVSYLGDKFATANELHYGSQAHLRLDANQFFGSHENTPVYLSANYYIQEEIARRKSMFSEEELVPGPLFQIQQDAWNNLNDQQKRDLEMYLILTLMGGGGEVSSAFSEVSKLLTYDYVTGMVWNNYAYYANLASKKIVGRIWRGRRDTLAYTHSSLSASLNTIQGNINAGFAGLMSSVAGLAESDAAYQANLSELAVLQGEKEDGFVEWIDIEQALSLIGYPSTDTARLKGYWEEMSEVSSSEYRSVTAALTGTARWAGSKNDAARATLEKQWTDDETDRVAAEAQYRALFTAYIAGEASLANMEDAACEAFGVSAPARKKHLETVERVLSGVFEEGRTITAEHAQFMSEYSSLLTRAMSQRQAAELSARETTWALQQSDLVRKAAEWEKDALIVIETGLADWDQAEGGFMERYNRWLADFAATYRRTDTAWSAVYAAGLKEKEAWLARAAEAADKAASGAALALVGADGEATARAFLASVPLAYMGSQAQEAAAAALSELCAGAGITNMAQAFSALNGSTSVLNTRAFGAVTGGASLWASGAITAEASRFAYKTNAKIAEREARRLAENVKIFAEDAMKSLRESVVQSNKQFRKSMDDMFMISGAWRKSGTYYIKDIVVYSTMIDPVITESVSVETYRDYTMNPALKPDTDLSEDTLAGLDSFAVAALIDNLYDEITAISERIFGKKGSDGGEEIKGEFNEWIGESPILISEEAERRRREYVWDGNIHNGLFGPPKISAEEMDGLFMKGSGSGELGRLMWVYMDWQRQESEGIRNMNTASWDKPMWDARNWGMDAPSFRQLNEFAAMVAATIVTCGAASMVALVATIAINMADDIMFAALDVGGGYKTGEEAMFGLAKKAVTYAATSAMGAGFNQLGGAVTNALTTSGASSLTKAATNAAFSGVRSVASGLVTSPISALTYTSTGGFGFNEDIMRQGIEGSWISAASGMASSFTKGSLGAVNLHAGENVPLNNRTFDVEKIGQLNNLIGSLAGGGVTYALTGNVTLNLVNLNLLKTLELTKNDYNMGLLELQLGKDGVGINFGNGGIDVSIGTMIAAAEGLKDAAKVTEAKLDNLFGNKESISTLNAVNMLGWSENGFRQYLASAIWEEKLGVSYKDLSEREALGEYILGSKEIALDMSLLGGGNEGSARLAAVMAHEGSHAFGNRVEFFAHLQGSETYNEINTNFGLQENNSFVAEMVFAMNNPENWTENTGDTDKWRLMGDGTLVMDKDGWLRYPDGRLVLDRNGNKIGAPGKEGGLLAILGVDPTDAEAVAKVQDMMKRYGFIHNPKDTNKRVDWYWNDPRNQGEKSTI